MFENALDYRLQDKIIQKSVTDSISNIFPIIGKKQTLKVNKVWIDDNLDINDIPDQKETKLRGKSWSVPIYIDAQLTDNSTGAVISKYNKLKVGDIPKLTSRFSAIIDGNEYQTVNQFRLKTGVYTRKMKNGDIVSQFNLDPGFNFKMKLDPNSYVFYLLAQNSKYRVYNLLTGLFSIPEDSIKKSWGSDIYNKNIDVSGKYLTSDILNLYEKTFKKKPDGDFEFIKNELRSYFSKTGISPDTTALTLGESYSSVSGETLLATSKKLLSVMRGEKPQDERDSLIFKELYVVNDLLDQHFLKRKKQMTKSLGYRVDVKSDIKNILNPRTFGDPIKDFFTQGDLTSTPTQMNPVNIVDEWKKTTITGTGGIGSRHAITNQVREVHPSTHGFLDSLSTPESGKVGVTLGLAMDTKKDPKLGMVTTLLLLNGKQEDFTPFRLWNTKVGFSDQYEKVDGKVVPKYKNIKATYQGKAVILPANEIEAFFPYASTMFSLTTNMIPFLANNNGNRGTMGSKQMGQSISIIGREDPLVKVKLQVESGQEIEFEDVIGNYLNPKAKKAGKVTKVTDDYIYLKYNDGTSDKLGLYNNFPLNQESFLHSTPKVSAGDTVKSGQFLAENNFNKNGKLALGSNVKVAYMPWHGYNFEDGIIVTESFAKNYTSEHIIKKSLLVGDSMVTNLTKFRAFFPEKINKENADKLDSMGIIKKGELVKEDDIIIAVLKEKEITDEEKRLRAMSKLLAVPYAAHIIEWDYSQPGVVEEVRTNGNVITVYIKMKQPLVVGDKLTGRHGDKGIVTKIIPDDDAPHTQSGERIDVMLNPHGIPGRMNIGQVLETAAGKLARKTGKTYIVENFDNKNHLETLKQEYAKNNLEFNEILLDGKDGKPFKNPVFTGEKYMMKLHHTVEHKLKGRSFGSYDVNEQPSRGKGGGQSLDHMFMYAMLAHGAKSNLYEATAIKGQKNDEYWRNLQLGLPLPKPEVPFVFNKMVGMLQGAGVDVQKEGNMFKLLPLTDKDIDKMSAGEIKDPGIKLRGKDLAVKKDGLFDPDVTGGLNGKKWAHINLAIKIPNPMFETPIQKLLDLSSTEYNKLLKSPNGVQEIESRLAAINIDEQIEKYTQELEKAPESKVNALNSKIRYLRALKDTGKTPVEAYIMSKVPVIPPSFRPIYPLPSGDLVSSPINNHYSDIGMINNAIKSDQKIDFIPGVVNNTTALYNSVKAMQGFIDPINYSREKYEGIIQTLAGANPKEGFVQNRVWGKKQDLSARSTITLEPSLGIDEVGLPSEIGKSIFEPFIVKKLIDSGIPALQARKEVKQWTPRAEKAMDLVMAERPVILNRAPTLHKHGVQALWAKKVDGKSIRMNPLINSGFNYDFDGDSLSDYISMTYKFETSKLKDFGLSSINDLTLDILMGILYGETWNLTHTHLINMFKDILVTIKDNKEAIFDIHIKDFPYVAGSKETTPKGNESYKVPEGISVFAYKDGKVQLMPVSHWSIHKNLETVEVTTLSNKKVTCSKDHSLFTYNPKSGELEKSTPIESIGRLTPVPKTFSVPSNDKSSFDDGYFIGVFCGDSWLNHGGIGDEYWKHSRLMLASIHDTIIDKLSEYIGGSKPYIIESPHTFDGHQCFSKKATWSGPNVASLIKTKVSKYHVGHGAKNKHLPYDFLTKSRNYRLGLLSGLLDTDGSISISNAKTKPQYLANYTTASNELKYQVQQLLASLGVRSSVSSYERKGNTYHNITISMIDLVSIKDELKLLVDKKAKLLKEACADVDKRDVIPIPTDLSNKLQKLVSSKDYYSLYIMISKSKSTGIISRASALKTYNMLNKEHFKDYKSWVKDILLNKNISWDKIVSVKETGLTETLWDLTVPDTWTFMTSNLLIVWDTMQVQVPVGKEAVEEAKNMVPSKILFKSGDFGLVPAISQEYMLGLYYLTSIDDKYKNNKPKEYSSISEVLKDKTLDEQEPIIVTGIGETSLGKILINAVLPTSLRDYKIVLNKKTTEKLLNTIAKEHKSDFAGVINSLKDLGNDYAHRYGATLSITDFDFDRKFRDDIVLETANKLKGEKDPNKIFNEWQSATKKIEIKQKELLKDKNPLKMLEAGSMSKANAVRQIMTFPGLFQDVKGNILPNPFVKSYAEGYDIFDYINAMPAVRKGMVDRAVNTQDSGALNKALLAVNKSLLIIEEDCGTNKGIEIEVSSKDVFDRALAVNVPGVGKKNDIVDNDITSKARDKKINTLLVRSPLTCESSNGICSYCYGLNEFGQLPNKGENVGVKDSQALTERSTQLTMRTFHTGGSAGGSEGVTAGFPRMVQLLSVPKTLENKATLATISGKVEKVKRNAIGGHDITISGVLHKVLPGLEVKVSVGDYVEKGNSISSGNIKPQELAETKSFLDAQKYIVDQMNDIYEDKFKKKSFETVVRGVSDNAVITRTNRDAGFLRGDLTHVSTIEKINKERKESGLAPIKYKPYFKSINFIPLDREDWLSRLGATRIEKTITDGVAKGMASNIHGTDPIPAYLYGKEFGKGDFY